MTLEQFPHLQALQPPGYQAPPQPIVRPEFDHLLPADAGRHDLQRGLLLCHHLWSGSGALHLLSPRQREKPPQHAVGGVLPPVLTAKRTGAASRGAFPPPVIKTGYGQP